MAKLVSVHEGSMNPQTINNEQLITSPNDCTQIKILNTVSLNRFVTVRLKENENINSHKLY